MKKIWFKRKLYGWGWYPSTWQGWLIMALYIGALIKISYIFDVDLNRTSTAPVGFVASVLFLTVILICICYKTGEKPKWQWGRRGIDKNS